MSAATSPPTPRSFFEYAFWALGAFCVYWFTKVFAAVHRFTEVELPIIGKCVQVEAVVYSLTFMWPILLLLHLTLHGFQRLAHESGERPPRFPGAMAGQAVPRELKVIRIGLFLVLMVWPTFVFGFLGGRALDHFRIVPSGNADQSLQNGQILEGAEVLLFPLKRPPGSTRDDSFRWVNGERREMKEITRPDASKSMDRVVVEAVSLQPFLIFLVTIAAVWSLFLAGWNGFAGQRRDFFFRRAKQGGEPVAI